MAHRGYRWTDYRLRRRDTRYEPDQTCEPERWTVDRIREGSQTGPADDTRRSIRDAIINNKLTFHLLIGSFSAYVPTLRGLLGGGTLTWNSPVMTVPSWQAEAPDRAGTDQQSGVARFDATTWIDGHA